MQDINMETDLDLIERKKLKLLAKLQERHVKTCVKEKKNAEKDVDLLISAAQEELEQKIVNEDTILKLEEALSLFSNHRGSRRIQEVLEALRKVSVAKSVPQTAGFSFKRAPKKATVSKEEDKAPPTVVDAPKESKVVIEPVISDNALTIVDKVGLNETIEGVDGSSLTLKNIENCVLRFAFRPTAVHMQSIDRCTLIFLPINTSILMHNVTSSCIFASAQQIRVHDSKQVVFHISVKGAIIFESCSEMDLAPYKLRHNNEQVPVHEGSQWTKPNDFDWLGEGPSPNYRILPEDQWTEECL